MEKEKTLSPNFEEYNKLSHFIANTCVRDNTLLETIHAGKYPVSVSGDYSDVKVIDGTGTEIPWNDLSHISDDQMRIFNKQVVNNVFSALFLLRDITLLGPVLNRATLPKNWDYAELNSDLLRGVLTFAAMTEDSRLDKAALKDIIGTINQKTRQLSTETRRPST